MRGNWLSSEPLIIVNADDFGLRSAATDAIVECYDARGISSTTAMVWMKDSRRAAALAGASGIPLGLHLNLTDPFTDPVTPPLVRDRQARLISFFRRPTRWLFNPLLHRAIESAIQDQLDAFRLIYSVEPSHLDGHHHVQFTPNVLLSRTLPASMKLRRTYTFDRGEKIFAKRAFRALMHASLVRRYRTPDYFFDLRHLHPDLGGSGVESKLDLARSASVEVMCHPEIADERRVLLSGVWVDGLHALRVGSFLTL